MLMIYVEPLARTTPDDVEDLNGRKFQDCTPKACNARHTAAQRWQEGTHCRGVAFRLMALTNLTFNIICIMRSMIWGVANQARAGIGAVNPPYPHASRRCLRQDGNPWSARGGAPIVTRSCNTAF